MLSHTQIPTLVLGPFGCGKTETLQEFVKLVSMNTPNDIKLLICTHTNSAADIYVQKLHTEWRQCANSKSWFVLYYCCICLLNLVG